jgi:hypothetical protein
LSRLLSIDWCYNWRALIHMHVFSVNIRWLNVLQFEHI